MLTITAYTLSNALGVGRGPVCEALFSGRSGLTLLAGDACRLESYYGYAHHVDDTAMHPGLEAYDCRNNRLALQAMQADDFDVRMGDAVARYGRERIGLFLGTSTSGIAETESAYAQREREDEALSPNHPFYTTHSLGALSAFVAAYLGVSGPVQTTSTACSSSAKVFAAAARHVAAGFCDAAIVGGVDSFCLTTLYGFNALELLSREPCRPWGAHRDGISIGEAAGFALLENGGDGIRLLGVGESADAHHMSSPHPDGAGAGLAMDRALQRASVAGRDIDYVNLHGTGTPANDAAEDQAVQTVFGCDVPCNSTKGLIGHTLGAAGITEALFCCLALENGRIPAGVSEAEKDPALAANYIADARPAPLSRVASLSLGFGGSNCCLVFGGTE